MAALAFLAPSAVKVETKMETQKSLDSSGKYNNNSSKPRTGFQLKTNIQAISRTQILKNKPEEMAYSSTPPPRREMITKQVDTGILLDNGLVFRQNYTVRSFEIGFDSKISIGALMNYLQETTLNHHKSVGLLADGFGSSPKMVPRDLIWVVCWSCIEVDQYPSWADVIQVDTWKYRAGKNGCGCDWHVHDFNTGKTLMRATSVYLLMNKKTRKFAKLDEEILEEIKPCLKDCDPIFHKDSRKMVKLNINNADHARTGLLPGWTDMDINQHVSHIKLVNYVLESVPRSVVGSHQLSAISLEYRNECNGDIELQSLSSVTNNNHLIANEVIEFDHLLRLECGREIVRGRTTWKQKYGNIAVKEVKNSNMLRIDGSKSHAIAENKNRMTEKIKSLL